MFVVHVVHNVVVMRDHRHIKAKTEALKIFQVTFWFQMMHRRKFVKPISYQEG